MNDITVSGSLNYILRASGKTDEEIDVDLLAEHLNGRELARAILKAAGFATGAMNYRSEDMARALIDPLEAVVAERKPERFDPSKRARHIALLVVGERDLQELVDLFEGLGKGTTRPTCTVRDLRKWLEHEATQLLGERLEALLRRWQSEDFIGYRHRRDRAPRERRAATRERVSVYQPPGRS